MRIRWLPLLIALPALAAEDPADLLKALARAAVPTERMAAMKALQAVKDQTSLKAAWAKAPFKACLSLLPSAFTRTADLVLPVTAFAETEGTFVNSQNRAQWIRPAVKPPGQAREAWRVLAALAGMKAARVQDVHAMLPEGIREGAPTPLIAANA